MKRLVADIAYPFDHPSAGWPPSRACRGRPSKGMRDKVGHDYPEIDIDLLWDTFVHGLPDVHRAIVNHQGR